mgnify:CR=1 FL=1
MQRNYSENTLESAVEWNTQCADAIHKLVLHKLTEEDYKNISTIADMQSERYQRLQKELCELRKLNPTRYLYTAKMGADGRPVYLIDGLDLDAKDFAYPGTYIEKEVVPYIEAALAGETVYSQEIVDTTWGNIFTGCYPVREDTGEVIGAICMEMDREQSCGGEDGYGCGHCFGAVCSRCVLHDTKKQREKRETAGAAAKGG